jgi:hypothetical protein
VLELGEDPLSFFRGESRDVLLGPSG